MDKEPISANEQKALYDECLKIYHKTVRSGEVIKLINLNICQIKLRYPETGMINKCLAGNKSQNNFSAHKNKISIYITDSLCKDFSFPDCPFERFRFTHRGDIQGFEEGCFKAVYTRNPAVLTVVNLKTNCAVLLIRDIINIDKIDIVNTILPALASLLKTYDIFIIPAKIQHDNYYTDLLIDLKLNISKLYSGTIKNKKHPRENNWVMIKANNHPKAIDINASILQEPEKISSKEPITIRIIADKDTSYKHKRDIDIYNNLIFNTLFLIPYAGKDHISFINDLFVSKDQNKSFRQNKFYATSFTAKTDHHHKKANYYAPQENKRSVHPKLSIIIPTYNSAMFLKDALDSVLSLNYDNKEIIIVDDGSTDNTKELVYKISSQIGIDINYYYQANAGVSAARNKGLDISEGELLIFLDADDILNIAAHYTLAEILNNNPKASAVTGFAQKFKKDKNGNIIFTGSPAESFPYYIGAAIFRRSAFGKAGKFDNELQMSEDTDWFTRAEEQNCLIYRADVISLFVRRHGGSLTNMAGIDDLQLISMLKKKIEREV